AERGGRMTSSLLAFARRQMLRTETVNLNTKLRDLLPVIEHNVGKAIQVELLLDPTVQDCKTDLAQLEGALLNLALNARDSMREGGTLTLATRLGTLAAIDLADNAEAVPGPFVAIVVRDTGSGMS